MNNEREKGQYYTKNNPFRYKAFKNWTKEVPEFKKRTLLEPFAGANNIVTLMEKQGFDNKWACFDIDPEVKELNNTSYPITIQDTIKKFPQGYSVAITNPPYLAKNSAKRRGLKFPNTEYDDLYKHCLKIMLDNLDYVAAIIPESFITSGLFHDRLYSVNSLTEPMFEDTEVPVCLALFVPNDFQIYVGGRLAGTYTSLKKHATFRAGKKAKWVFNDPKGVLGLQAIDNQTEASIKFLKGEDISSKEIKGSSRSRTRISGVPDDIALDELIEEANQVLHYMRLKTYDVFLTAFKGLRKDSKYRRRLDWDLTRNILNQAVQNIRRERNKK